MTQTQSLRRGMRRRLGLGTGSRRASGEGNKATPGKRLVPWLRCAQQTQDGLLHLVCGKTSHSGTLSHSAPEPPHAAHQLYGARTEFGPQNAAPRAEMPALLLAPGPGSQLPAPSSSKTRSRRVVFQAGINKKPQPQRYESEKEKKDPPKEDPNQHVTREQLQPCPSLPVGDGEGCGWHPWVTWVAPGVSVSDSAGCPPW